MPQHTEGRFGQRIQDDRQRLFDDQAINDEARWQMQEGHDVLIDFIENLSTLLNHYYRTIVIYLDHR